MTKLFKVVTQDEMTDSLAAFMPGGRVFASKGDNDSTLRKYLDGLAVELSRIDEQMNLMSEDHDINLTVQFLEQWESAVGIPDDCFNATGTIEERRINVLAKLARMNLTTEQDFIDLAAFLGVTITIDHGATATKADRFTMIVNFAISLETFPYTFPFSFGDATQGLIECIFNKLKPANVLIIYQ